LHILTGFSSTNKPVLLLGFLVDKLIKHAHNPIKGGHKLSKETDNLRMEAEVEKDTLAGPPPVRDGSTQHQRCAHPAS